MTIQKLLKKEGVTTQNLLKNYHKINQILKEFQINDINKLNKTLILEAIQNLKNPAENTKKPIKSELIEKDKEGNTLFASFFESWKRDEDDELPFAGYISDKKTKQDEIQNPNIKILKETRKNPDFGYINTILNFVNSSKKATNPFLTKNDYKIFRDIQKTTKKNEYITNESKTKKEFLLLKKERQKNTLNKAYSKAYSKKEIYQIQKEAREFWSQNCLYI